MTRKFALFCACIGLIVASFGCDDVVDSQSPLACTTSGETRCENNTQQMCNGTEWTTVTTCPNGCNGTTCAVLPTPECYVTVCKNSTTLTVCSADFKATDVNCVEGQECINNACQSPKNETDCKDSEHFFADKCEADDLLHCGTHTNDCTKFTGWKSGNCISKKCFAEECELGYHLASIFDSNNKERTICEQDTHEACGSINTRCNPDEICTLGKCKDSCQPGEVNCDGSCINPNTSKDFCGSDVSCSSYIPCSETEDCIDGKCVLLSCSNAEESICIENAKSLCVNVHGNNPKHCGDCGIVCSDNETAKASGCEHGKCIYICKENLVNCGSSTEPLCLSGDQLNHDPLHCGKCDSKCNDNELCQNGQCIVSLCKSNECLYNNSCINQNEHCGTQCANCNTANNASAGICQNGTCKITSCVAGYHLTSVDKCAKDSAMACPNGKASGTVNCNTIDQYTKTGNCVKGVCQATECQTNAHLKNGKCIADTTTKCGESETNCSLLAGWNNGNCVKGKCVATTCKSGYCLNSLQGLCTDAQSNTTCGTDGGTCQSCNQKQVCSTGMCVDKQCEGNVCNQTQVSDETLVCKNDNTHCGMDCLNCNTFTSNATAGTCNTNGSCKLMSCKPGFHTYNNACEADSTTHCGKHGTACLTGQICDAGNCVFSSLKIGDIMTFGHYEQDNDTTNGQEPIEWRVLDIDSDGHLLIISDKVLDTIHYSLPYGACTYEKSMLRSWLNGYDSSNNNYGEDYSSNNFIDIAFTDGEKAKIITSYVPAHSNPSYSTNPGLATTDMVFVLSVVEANKYFNTNKARIAYTTFYALTKGAEALNEDTSKYCSTSYFQVDKCAAIWWLRSPGENLFHAAYVEHKGKFVEGSVSYVLGVRPALWYSP